MTTYNRTMESPAEKAYARNQQKLMKRQAKPASPADLGILQAVLDDCDGLSDDSRLTALEAECLHLGIDKSAAYDLIFG
jgi:hypothetical protein